MTNRRGAKPAAEAGAASAAPGAPDTSDPVDGPAWGLLESVSDLAVLVRDDAIQYANRPGAILIGAAWPGDIVGQRLDRFFDARAVHQALLRASKSTGNAPVAWQRSRLIRLDGTAVEIDLLTVPMPAQRLLGVLARRVDATAILADGASTDAHATDGMNQLVASMAHELRTPLNAIIGFAEILTGQMFGEINQRYVSYAEDIAASGQHLLRIVNDILDYAKVESGELAMRLESASLTDVVRASLRLVAGQADRAGVVLADELGGPWPTVRIDATKIKQVLVNLLMNAVKFTPRGGRVTVRLANAEGGNIAVTVSDTGIGMTEAEAAEALLPFRQPKRPPDGGYAGTGLGLPIAKALVTLHGGVLRISSVPDKGTDVTFTIPTKRTP